jgi:hypothetical protein
VHGSGPVSLYRPGPSARGGGVAGVAGVDVRAATAHVETDASVHVDHRIEVEIEVGVEVIITEALCIRQVECEVHVSLQIMPSRQHGEVVLYQGDRGC